MEFDLYTLLIVVPLIFLGGFVDSIAGGGGVINMIAFMITGIPMHYAIGTNKTQALFGTSIATYNYVKKNHYNKDFIIPSIFGSIIGAFLGSKLSIALNQETLKLIVTIILPLVTFILVSGKKPKINLDNKSIKHTFIAAFIIGITIGFYDGAIGPGAGTFYIIAFSMVGLSLLEANGNAKIVNLTSNIVAAIMFILSGKIIIWLVLPCIIVSMIANNIGSKLAIKNGEKIVKPIMIAILTLLFIKTIFDFIN